MRFLVVDYSRAQPEEKAVPTISTAPTAAAITYGQTLANSTLTDGTASVEGTFAWKTPATAPAVSDSNTTEYDVIFTPTDTANNKTVECKVKLTVNKANTAAPTTVGKTDETISGKSDGSITGVGDTMEYRKDGTTAYTAVTGTAITGLKPGKYYVRYKETDNYKASPDVSVEITAGIAMTEVAKVEPTCTEKGKEAHYKGSDDKLYSKNGDKYTLIEDESTLEIPALGHSMTPHAAAAATCTKAGNNAYWYCDRCEKYFSDANGNTEITENSWIIDKLGHNFVNGVCTRCDEKDPDYVEPEPEPEPEKPLFVKPVYDPSKVKPAETKAPEETKVPEETTVPEKEPTDETKPRETIKLDDTVVPADLLEQIAGKDIDIVIDLGNDMQWTINGKSISGDLKDIDMSVSFDSGIPVDVINKVTGERFSICIHLNYDGLLPFEAILTVNLKAGNAGYYANLFYYDPAAKELEFVSASKIDKNGNADLNFCHASDYTIIIDDHPLDGSSEVSADSDDANPHTGTGFAGLGAMALAGIALFTARKRKNK